MSTFPTAFSRTPNLLFTQTSLNALNRTNFQLLRVNEQLSTQLDLLRPSDDPTRAATVSTLDARLERSDQILRNLGFATDSLSSLDAALGDAKNLIDEALGIANEQISTPADAETRAAQATIVDSLIQSLYGIANRESVVGYIFGGTQPGQGPIELIGNSYRFVGGFGGLQAELGGVSDIPITMGADNAIGAVSARVEGTVDLDPNLTVNTRLSDLNGARSLGVSTGVVTIRFNGGATAEIDLTGTETVGDVADAIEAGIRQYETDNGVTVLGPGGVSISGGSLSIDVPAGSLEVGDVQGSFVALDLGLTDGAGAVFTAGTPDGIDLDARLTWTTPVSQLAGLGGNALDQVMLTTGGIDYTIDLSSAETLADIRSAFEAGGTNVVVEISDDGRSINVKTAVAGTLDQAMSISEVSGGNPTAELLGVRTLQSDTLLSDFNDARGVRVNENEPDFEATLGDGFTLTFDLDSGDIGTVGDLLAAINAQAAAQLTAAGRPVTDFQAVLTSPSNGIAFEQSGALGGTGPLDVKRLNNSGLLEDLGFLDATLEAGQTTLVAQDRSRVRVDNLFTHLLDLAAALRDNDQLGIEVASGKLSDSVDRLSQSRAVVGGYGKRVDDEIRRQEDRQVLDESLRSQLRDLDFAAASTRFGQLQLQLQAGLSVASQSQQLTLLDFLG